MAARTGKSAIILHLPSAPVHGTTIGQSPIRGGSCRMEISKIELLREALGRDLRPAGSKELIQVTDDSARKVFTANKDGAVLVFGHSQPDAAYWNGVKHYGSGPSSRIRIRRTPVAKAKPPGKEKEKVPAT